MPDTPFLITVDTEGDDLWSRPRQITTRNARYLPRFQALCERFGYKPVYLANYEMAMSDAFVEFGRDVLARDAGEIGMHLHAWNSPPLVPLTGDDFRHQPYLIEYPDHVMRDKIRLLTHLLQDRFGRPMASHRAGRVGFDDRYAAMLIAEGYRVDCSVTPGVDWSGMPGAPGGRGGTDYTGFPTQPYFLSADDIARPAVEGLLEVPVTVHAGELYRRLPWLYRVPLLRTLLQRFSPGLSWVCPGENGLDGMLRAAVAARAAGHPHIELMLHSSELMPGGSPTFRTGPDVERLYDQLEALFGRLSAWCRGMTLVEFHSRVTAEGA